MTDTYLPTEYRLEVSLNLPLGLFLLYQAFDDDRMQSKPLEERLSRYYEIVQANPPQGKLFGRRVIDVGLEHGDYRYNSGAGAVLQPDIDKQCGRRRM